MRNLARDPSSGSGDPLGAGCHQTQGRKNKSKRMDRRGLGVGLVVLTEDGVEEKGFVGVPVTRTRRKGSMEGRP